MKKILIPVDFSQEQDTIFEFAARVAKKTGASITLLHITEFPSVPGNFMQPVEYLGDFYQAQMDMQDNELKKLLVHPALAGARVNTFILGGAIRGPGEEIAEYAARENFDLVILWSRHRKGLSQVFGGSELLRIVRFCKTPMIILSPGKLPQFNRMVFATDFSDESADLFKKVRVLADALGARLDVFRVNTLSDFQNQRDFVAERNAWIPKAGATHIPEIEMYNDWDLENGIIHFAEDNAADFIVMATHGRKGMGHLFYGSLTEEIVKDSTFPVLVVNMAE